MGHPYGKISAVDKNLDRGHVTAKSAVVVLLGIGGLLLAGCSSGPSLAQRQADVIQQTQKVTDEANALIYAQEEYVQGVAKPCPANLTPGSFPGYDCGNSPFTPRQIRQAMDAISKAKSQLAAEEAKCVVSVDNLHGQRVRGVVAKKAYCLPTVPSMPTDSPPA